MDVESYTDGISFNYPKEKMFIFLSLHILINVKKSLFEFIDKDKHSIRDYYLWQSRWNLLRFTKNFAKNISICLDILLIISVKKKLGNIVLLVKLQILIILLM